MNRTTFAIFLILILGIAGSVVWYLVDTRQASLERPGQEMPAPTLNEGSAIYTNGVYGFTLLYPESADVEYEFSSTYHLGTTWRANALPESVGAPIVAIIPYSVESDVSYPRSFAAMVRIGASEDPKELAACLAPTESQGETELPSVTIGGTPFKAFSFENAGMMQYVRGVSYRALLDGRCIAIEKIQAGSSYRDDPHPDDIPEETLQAAYDSLDDIVNSISFVAR